MLLSSITILHLFVCAPAKSNLKYSVAVVAPSPKHGTSEKPESITLDVKQFANSVAKDEAVCCSMCTEEPECKMWTLSPHEDASAGLSFCKLYKSECTEMYGIPKVALRNECETGASASGPRVLGVGSSLRSITTSTWVNCCRRCANQARCKMWDWKAAGRPSEAGRCTMLRGENTCRKMKGYVEDGWCVDEGLKEWPTKWLSCAALVGRYPGECNRNEVKKVCRKSCEACDTEVEMLLVRKPFKRDNTLPTKADCGKSCSEDPGCEAWVWSARKKLCKMHGHKCARIEGNYRARKATTSCANTDALVSETKTVLVKQKLYRKVDKIDRTTCCAKCSNTPHCKIWRWRQQQQQTGTGGTCYMYKSCNKYRKVTGNGKVPSDVDGPEEQIRRRKSTRRHSKKNVIPLNSSPPTGITIPATQEPRRKLRGSYSQ